LRGIKTQRPSLCNGKARAFSLIRGALKDALCKPKKGIHAQAHKTVDKSSGCIVMIIIINKESRNYPVNDTQK
jgi:hypothetical protein